MRLALAAVACAAVVSGCDFAAPGQGTADKAARALEALGPAYSYTLTSSCGERGGLGTFRVAVQNGSTVSVAGPGAGGLSLDYFPSVEDLLRRIIDPPEGQTVRASFDRQGSLVSVDFDYRPRAIDDEECYTISDLEEGTTDE